jgi:hypothetical protein
MARREASSSRIRSTKADRGRSRLAKSDKKSPIAQLAKIKSSTGIVIPEVKKVILAQHEKNASRASRRSNTIYPSEMARSEWCPRATYYRMSGMPEPATSNSFSLDNVFSEGNRIHSKWQGWLAETGLLWGDWYCKECGTRVNNSLRPEERELLTVNNWETETHYHCWEYKEVTLRSTSHKISGHADGALINHNVLIEIKSMGIGTFRFEAPALLKEHTYEIGGKKITDIEGMWRDIHRPLLSHVKQGNIYLHMAEEMGMPFSTLQFIYEFKANQQVKEFSITKSDDILMPMLETAKKIEEGLALGIPPMCRNDSGGCESCRAFEKNRN